MAKEARAELSKLDEESNYCLQRSGIFAPVEDTRMIPSPKIVNEGIETVEVDCSVTSIKESFDEMLAKLEEMKSRNQLIQRLHVDEATHLVCDVAEAVCDAKRMVADLKKQLEEMLVTLVTAIERKAQETSRLARIHRRSSTEFKARHLCRKLRSLVRSTSAREMVTAQQNVRTEFLRLQKLQEESNVEVHLAKPPFLGKHVVDEIGLFRQQLSTFQNNLVLLTSAPDILLSFGGDGTTTSNDASAYYSSEQKWTAVSKMQYSRCSAAATSWRNKVMVTGGFPARNSVELYDPVTNDWTSLPNLLTGRFYHAVANLNDAVFAIGGDAHGPVTNTVERYDAEKDVWEEVPVLTTARAGLVAAALQNQIVVAGGVDEASSPLSSCESYDIAKGAWSPVASLTKPRCYAAAAAHDEKIYVFGGRNKRSMDYKDGEEYSAAAGTWTIIDACMSVERNQLAVACLNGRMYIMGGCNGRSSDALDTTDCYDPQTRQLTTVAPLMMRCSGLTAAIAKLPAQSPEASSKQHKDSEFLLCIGGMRGPNLKNVNAYFPASKKWCTITQMKTARGYAAATVWNQKVVIAGGWPYDRMVEQYDPATNDWSTLADLVIGRKYFSLANLNGTLFAIGGLVKGAPDSSVERYDPEMNKWETAPALGAVRYGFASANLPKRIVVAGGIDERKCTLATCEAYDEAEQKWLSICALNKKRYFAGAAAHNGTVYVLGGRFRDIARDDVEQYNAIADKWTIMEMPMSLGRYNHAVAFVNGRTYVLGGCNSMDFTPIDSVEFLNPIGQRFVDSTALPAASYALSAVSFHASDDILSRFMRLPQSAV